MNIPRTNQLHYIQNTKSKKNKKQSRTSLAASRENVGEWSKRVSKHNFFKI